MAYVDGFVVPLPKKNLGAYRAMAKKAAKVWREHGALAVHETVADDVKPGKWTSFPQSVKLKGNETEIMDWVKRHDEYQDAAPVGACCHTSA